MNNAFTRIFWVLVGLALLWQLNATCSTSRSEVAKTGGGVQAASNKTNGKHVGGYRWRQV